MVIGKRGPGSSMTNLPLFGEEGPAATRKLAARLRELVAAKIYFGTSSWKYEGWLGQVYSPERYLTRGRFSRKKFNERCLSEYAGTFPVVCGDFSFYQFPPVEYWRKLFLSAPRELLYAFKVPEEITVKRFPTHPRYGARGGSANGNFLNLELFKQDFLKPLEPYRKQVVALIFEFGAFSKAAYKTVDAFASDLDAFLAKLPCDLRYSVEIRNPEFLAPAYFECLRNHNVAHIFNAWARMPELGSQMAVPGAFTADFTVTRALLQRGRGYENAVKLFQPYDRVQEPNLPAREALRDLIKRARASDQPAFVFVNNRLEGNAPGTIEAVLDE